MIANNYFTEDEDLQVFFRHLIDWSEIVPAFEGHDFADHARYAATKNARLEMAPGSVDEAVALYESTLEALGEFAGKEISQAAREMDRTPVRWETGRVVFPEATVRTYEKFRSTGLLPYSISRGAGGLGLPAVVGAFFVMLLARADVSRHLRRSWVKKGWALRGIHPA